MVIYTPKPRPVAAGFWTFCDQTGDLCHVDAHADSTVCTRWPLLDRWHRNLIERGVDWLLNAAGAGRERLDASLRVPYPGSRLDRLPAIQSAFWHRLLIGQSGAATIQMYLGDGQPGFAGLAIDDSKDGTTILGWSGGAGAPQRGRPGSIGGGPGRGGGGDSERNFGDGSGAGGAGGGFGTAGGAGGRGSSSSPGGVAGEATQVNWTLAAVIANSYTRDLLAMGGSGGGGGGGVSPGTQNRVGGAGGASGNGRVRISVGDLTETTDRTLAGSNGAQGNKKGSYSGGSGGGGSGGLYLALCVRDYRLNNGVTIRCPGGSGGTNGGDGGAGGNGRVIVCYGDSVDTSAGTINNAVPTTYQLLPSLPLGQVRVS